MNCFNSQEYYSCSTICKSINEFAGYDLEVELIMLDAMEDYDRRIAEQSPVEGGCYVY